jgi:hypothetical protein
MALASSPGGVGRLVGRSIQLTGEPVAGCPERFGVAEQRASSEMAEVIQLLEIALGRSQPRRDTSVLPRATIGAGY